MQHPHTGFAHLRLDAYHAAEELAATVYRAVADFPPGHADMKDQLLRASAAVPRNTAEAANRAGPRDRRARFVVARGECGECDSVIRLALRVGLLPAERALPLLQMTDRVGALLTGLIRKETSRLEP
ncbi:MAG: four helix bundle protein [Planctomycetota bacterium]|nr:four helix bundle protein [Planctomycetota bacterium]